jgi:hypothetical protein
VDWVGFVHASLTEAASCSCRLAEGRVAALGKLFDKWQYRKNATHARYASHTFLAKEGPLSKALIPADILAWPLTNWRRGGDQSKELKRLLRVNTLHKDFDSDEIRAVIARSKRQMENFDKAGQPRKPKTTS